MPGTYKVTGIDPGPTAFQLGNCLTMRKSRDVVNTPGMYAKLRGSAMGWMNSAGTINNLVFFGSSAESVGRIEVLLKEVWVGWGRSAARRDKALAALGARLPRTVGPGRQPAARVLRCAAVLRMTAATDRAGGPCGPAGRLALDRLAASATAERRLFVSFIAVDRPRKVHPLAPPGWERRGWRWSDREPLGRTGAGTEFGRHRLFLRPEWIHEREGSKTSTGAGKDARSYRSRH